MNATHSATSARARSSGRDISVPHARDSLEQPARVLSAGLGRDLGRTLERGLEDRLHAEEQQVGIGRLLVEQAVGLGQRPVESSGIERRLQRAPSQRPVPGPSFRPACQQRQRPLRLAGLDERLAEQPVDGRETVEADE